MGEPKRKVRLRFGRPVGERITSIYGKFGAPPFFYWSGPGFVVLVSLGDRGWNKTRRFT